MKTIIAAAAIALTTITQASAMDSVSQYEGKNRVLVLFGPSGDPDLAQQVEMLKGQRQGLAERDMVVFTIVGGDVRPVFGDAAGVNARQLRKEAGIGNDGFQAVLIGKDGGVKLRSSTVISDVDMFGLIDRMPMRKNGQS